MPLAQIAAALAIPKPVPSPEPSALVGGNRLAGDSRPR